MKKIILIGLLCSISLLAFCQTINVSLSATGTQPYNASGGFIINANSSYSGINSGTVVTFKFSYDNTKISFANCNTSAYVFASSINGNITTQTTTFVAQAGNNQFLSLPLCFNFVCPSICMGQNISAIINSTVSTSQLNTVSQPLSIAGVLQNTFSGTNNWYSFLLTSYTVTFKAHIKFGACHKVTNPKFIVTPNMGTLLSASNATVSGNTITPNILALQGQSATNIYEQYYTIQLPCNTPANTVVGCYFQVQGTNCGLNNQIITNLPAASFTLPTSVTPAPNSTLTGNFLVNNLGNNYLQTTLTNTGNTTLNLTQTIDIPNVKTIKLFHNNNSSLNSSVSLQWVDCNNVASGAVNLPIASFNTTPPTYAKKAKLTINGLPPGEKNVFHLFYDFSNSCNGIPNSTSYVFNTNAVYNCVSLPNSCNPCGQGSGQATSPPIIYNTKPLIQCTKVSEFQINSCFKTNDIIELFIKFRNIGTAPLINGVLAYPLPAGLSYVPNSVVYSGFLTNPTLINNTNINWTLPASLPVSPTGTEYEIKFKVKVNSSATFGTLNFSSTLSAPGYVPHPSWCPQVFNICQITLANVVKEVKGDLDNTFSQNGTATPNSTALYKITIYNTGTTLLNNVTLVDRQPFIGDKRITDCQPRNSAFTIQPPNALTSIAGISSIEYSSLQNVATGWANTTTACNIPSQLNTFSSGFSANNIKFKLANPILPGSSFSFQFPAKISATASSNSLACNSIAFIADFTNSGGVKQGDVTAIESNNACIQISQATNPCPTCNLTTKFYSNGVWGTPLSSTIPNNVVCNQNIDISRVITCSPPVIGNQNITATFYDVNNLTPSWANNINNNVLNIPPNTIGTYYLKYEWKMTGSNIVCGTIIYTINITCIQVPPSCHLIVTGIPKCNSATTATNSINASTTGGTAPYAYTWSTNPPQTTASLLNVLPGNYSVTVTDAVGCKKTQSLSLDCPPPPPICNFIANAGPDKTICKGTSTTIGTTVLTPNGETYSWTSSPASTIPNTSMPTVAPTITTTYTLTVTKPNCPPKTDVVVVTVNDCSCNCQSAINCATRLLYKDENGTTKRFSCNGTITAKCNKLYSFVPEFECTNNCVATVSLEVTGPTGNPQIYSNVSSTNPANITFSSTGTYSCIYRFYINGVECSKCYFTVNTTCPPSCTPCTTKLASPIRDTLVPYQGMSSLLEAFTFTNLPANITEVRATVTNFTLTSVDANGKVNDECTQCNTNATTWASVWGGDKIDGIKPKVNLNGVETLGNITLPQMTPNKNPRHAVWSNNGAILNVPSTIKVGFFLPAKSNLSCCTAKANICIKFVFRNDKCEECVVSRCFDVIIDK